MKAVRAVWKGIEIAATDNPVLVEGNYYFPEEDVVHDYLAASELSTHCPWKGDASYFSVEIFGETLEDAAWVYLHPSKEARRIKGYYAFWKGVEIIKESDADRNARMSEVVRSFFSGYDASSKDEDLLTQFRSTLLGLGSDGLFELLPESFIQKLGFFNFQNSNNPCFFVNHKGVIELTNPTLSWALNHLSDQTGKTLESFLSHFSIESSENLDDVMKTLESHGWVRVPKLKTIKDHKPVYYSLDIAISKHGSKDSLTGIQGQLIDITAEVELTQAVEKSEQNVKTLLSGLQEGLFYFDREGRIPEDRSAALDVILGDHSSFATLHEFANIFKSCSEADIATCLDMLWPDPDEAFFSDFRTTISMLPQKGKVTLNGVPRDFTIEYRQVEHDEKIIVIVNDVTEFLKNQIEAEKSAQRVDCLSKAASNRESYLSFAEETIELVGRVAQSLSAKDEAEVNQIKRDLHTLKGSWGTFGFGDLSSYVHDLEDKIDEAGCFYEECLKAWGDIQSAWDAQSLEISEVLGLEKNRGTTVVELAKIECLRRTLLDENRNDLASQVDALQNRKPATVFSKYSDYIESLNERFPEKNVHLAFDESSEELSFALAQQLDGAFIHIFRNGFDHAIESLEERDSCGKPSSGTITVGVQYQGDSAKFTIADDGRGIDGQKLAEKARTNGVWSEETFQAASDKDRIELIFAPNLSSKDEVSSVSGRGVGMDAVKNLVEDLGGTIQVDSVPGKGTTFEIAIPYPLGEQKQAA
ncbi:MAG: DUF427 domain-containing protein [Pseudobacteriovorax sp.]|nr:DUF427 domain-containing protein [Pseudobacteriovorax sp.]